MFARLVLVAAVLACLAPASSAAIGPPAISLRFHSGLTAGAQPAGIAAGPQFDHSMWFTEAGTHAIGRISTDDGSISEYPAGGNAAPSGIALAGGSTLWYTEPSANTLLSISSLGVAGPSTAMTTASSGPDALTLGPDGALWVSESAAGKVARATTGAVVTNEYAATSPGSITTGLDGALWFIAGNGIGRITTGGTETEYPLPSGYSAPKSIAAGSDGRLWFIDYQGGFADVASLDPTSHEVVERPLGTRCHPNQIVSLAADATLWFTCSDAVGRMTTDGSFTLYPTPPPTGDTTGRSVDALAVSAAGDLWATAPGTNQIAHVAFGAPDAVTGAADAITTGGGTVHAQVDPHGADTTFHFEYGTNPLLLDSDGADRDVGSQNGPQDVSATLTGLLADTPVYYRVVTTSADAREYGAIQTFTPHALPHVSMTPSSHDFGSADIGVSAASQDFTVTNDGPGTLTVNEARLSDTTNFAATADGCASVAASATCTVHVTATPASDGPHSATLTILANASNGAQASLTVTGIVPVSTTTTTTATTTTPPIGAAPPPIHPPDITAPSSTDRIVFVRCATDVSCYTAPGLSSTDIWVMNADGSDQTQLTRAGTGHITLATSSCTFGCPAQFTQPTFSPDGKRIAYVYTHRVTTAGLKNTAPIVSSIWVMDADGSHPYQVTHPQVPYEGDVTPSWSPDGTRIAFERLRQPAGFDPNWQNEHYPNGDAWVHALSPGDDVWALAPRTSVWTVGADGSGAAAVPLHSPPLRSTHPGIKDPNGNPTPDVHEVTYEGIEDISDPLWEPDGATIALAMDNSDPFRAETGVQEVGLDGLLKPYLFRTPVGWGSPPWVIFGTLTSPSLDAPMVPGIGNDAGYGVVTSGNAWADGGLDYARGTAQLSSPEGIWFWGEDGTQRQLVPGDAADPAPAPRGPQLAYDAPDVVAVGAALGRARTRAVSPLVHTRSIYLTDAEGRNGRVIATNGFQPDWWGESKYCPPGPNGCGTPISYVPDKDKLKWGQVAAGGTVEQQLSIQNSATQNLVVGQVSAAGSLPPAGVLQAGLGAGAFAIAATAKPAAPKAPVQPFGVVKDGCSNTSIAPGASCAVRVRFAPPGPGAYTGWLTIPTPDHPAGGVPLSGTGGGFAPTVTAFAPTHGAHAFRYTLSAAANVVVLVTKRATAKACAKKHRCASTRYAVLRTRAAKVRGTVTIPGRSGAKRLTKGTYVVTIAVTASNWESPLRSLSFSVR